MNACIRAMDAGDVDAALALWRATAGVGVNERDTPDALAGYFVRNPGMSRVACDGAALVGTVLAGHDGRRGYLHHLAVSPDWRGRGIGRALVDAAIGALAGAGFTTCHCFVYPDNAVGLAFWSGMGWRRRHDLVVMTRDPARS
jgi:N-acetylglutamate synthase